MRTRFFGPRRDRRSVLPRNRRGYGLIELAIAVFLLTVSMGVMVKAVTWVGIERRAADRRVMAIQEASNLLERLCAEPFEKITADRAKALGAESPALKELPGASWGFEVVESKANSPAGKRISAKLRWKDRSAGWDGPVSLSCWVYPRRKP